MRKINVLHIVEDLKIGGIERIIATIAENLDKERYNVGVWCLARGGAIAEDLQDKGIKVEILGMGYRCSPFFLLRLYRRMKQAKIDILHSHGYTATTVGRLAAIFARVPIILTHIHTSFEKWTRRQILIERFLNLFTDKIICCSQAVVHSAKEHIKIKAEKGVVVYNGVDRADFLEKVDPIEIRKEFNLSPEARVIGCVASLTSHKGHRYLLEAAKIITKSQLPKSEIPKFLLAGDGPLRKDLEEHAQQLGIGSEVIFAGIRKDIPKILSIVDVVVLPSCQYEGLGICLIEAMAAGKPVIGTKLGGIPEVIKVNETGILVPPEDPEALAEAIISLLKDEERSKTMGLAGQSLYEKKFTTEIMMQEIEELYSFLIKKKNKLILFSWKKRMFSEITKIFADSFLKLLALVGISKDMIGWIQFHLSLWNGIIIPHFGMEVNERTAEYLWLLRDLKKVRAKVLDVGCSGSFLSYELIHREYDVYGVDTQPYSNRPEKLRFYQEDVCNLPFKDDSFDMIIAISTMEHIGLGSFEDPIYEDGDFKAIKELERVLKKGGEIFLTVPFANRYTVTWQRFYDRDRLLKLAKGLSIVKEEFYIKEGNKWVKSDFEKVKKVSFDPKVNVVACLMLKKPTKIEKISAALIVKDEEKHIRQCLEGLTWLDEIVILDGYSSDRTVEIAKEFTDKIYQKEFTGFPEERQCLLSKTSNNWVFMVDADMVITKELREEIVEIFSKPADEYAAFNLRFLNIYLGKEIRHCGWFDPNNARLFDKRKGAYDTRMKYIDLFIPQGKIGVMKNYILHFAFETVSEHTVRINRYSTLNAHDLDVKGYRITKLNIFWFFIIKPIFILLYKFGYKRGFLDGIEGFILSLMSAITYGLSYFKLWEMQKKRT